jgi:hypothetical protein
MAIQSFRALIEGLYESEGFKKAFLTVFVADYGIKVESSKNMLTISFSRTGAVNVKIAETDEKKSWGVWGAAVDALEAADGSTAGMVEGGFILRAECTSRVIKFDSKRNKKQKKTRRSASVLPVGCS